ncbi:F-box domain-containing protein [Mycena chlorophos]|uniref:F-box domain-containing protein n=1 Tax=Mycena chlorophos TaxID=658473 RepID=A0A8H6W4P1_MYCCL|nr:F-box domain-containing protein [Mycena chlorophos]
MPSLSSLPTELILEIAQAAPQADLAALCLVDRRLCESVTEQLYRSVLISDEPALEGFCATIEKRPEYRSFVRGLNMDFANGDAELAIELGLSQRWPGDGFSYRALRFVAYTQTLELLTELRALRSTHYSVPALLQSQNAAFPHLRYLECMLVHNIVPFITGRTALQGINILGGETLSVPEPDDVEREPGCTCCIPPGPPPVRTPNLHSFQGPYSLAIHVLPGSRVAQPIIAWPCCPRVFVPMHQPANAISGEPQQTLLVPTIVPDHPVTQSFDAQVARCLRAAAAAAVPVTHLTNLVAEWETLEPAVVAEHLPELRYLFFGHAARLWEDEEPLLTKINDTLPAFHKLQVLIVAHDPDAPTETWECAVFGDEYERDLREICPTLVDYLVTRRQQRPEAQEVPTLAMLD